MRLLLDTHPLLWWVGGGSRLSEAARQAIADPANDVVVSAASISEAGIKHALGKLSIDGGALLDEARRLSLVVIDMTADDALVAAGLPPHHSDPFDRMLAAQAMRRGLTLVTRDARLSNYGVPVLAP